MAGTRGRRRPAAKRAREDYEEAQSHSGLLSSPASRYQTRSARGGHSQPATLTSPRRNAIRSIITTPSQNSTAPLPREDPVTHSAAAASSRVNNAMLPNSTEMDMSISVESTHCPAPINQVHYEPTKGDYIGPKLNSYTRSNSNITEFAKKLLEEMDEDPEEVESALDPNFEDVNGHKVKKEIAPLLKSIFTKYNDLTRETNVSPNILALFLQRLCEIYRTLEMKNFFEITRIELDDMVDDVGYLQSQKIDVGWLLEKLEHISQTKIDLSKYVGLKDEAAKHEASIVRMKKEMFDMQKKIEAEIVAEQAKADEKRELARDISDRANSHKRSMVDGLL